MKKGKPESLRYLDSLSESDRPLLEGFFSGLARRVVLTTDHAMQLHGDFERAFQRYATMGVSLDAAMERLDPSLLGGFYARPPTLWYPLDDAAKIYPLSMKKNQMAVFRLSACMKEEVVPELLQMALNFTIKRFPSFATTVKKGFFWHYLDAAKRRFTVEPETGIPCRPLDVSASVSQSFRVLYFHERISVEFFHVLTDGTGGMIFLKTLVAEYLRLLGVPVPCTDGVLDINEISLAAETSNDFPKAEPTRKASGFVDKPAVQMSGRLSSVKPCQVLHFNLDSAALRDTAKRKGFSVTAYTLALMFAAHRYATDEPGGTVQIQVPVNMRKFFSSSTLRNFAMYCIIRIPLSDIIGPDALMPGIARQLEEKASRESMNEMMNATVGLVRALRHVPLFIKRPVAGLVYGFLGDKVFSNTLSNLGIVSVPAEMAAHVEELDVVLGPAVTNRAACGMVSFGNTTVLSVTKCTAESTFEERLYDLLKADGLQPRVRGSELYGH